MVSKPVDPDDLEPEPEPEPDDPGYIGDRPNHSLCPFCGSILTIHPLP